MTATADAPTENDDEAPDVLVVEDNPGDRRLIAEGFESTTRETTLRVVTSGDDALEYLSAVGTTADDLPGLVLLDLNLPGSGGIEVLREIKDDPNLRQLPVVILTSSEDRRDVRQCYEAQANAYLTKPTSYAEFLRLVEELERFWLERAELATT